MKIFEDALETLKSKYNVDLIASFDNVHKAIESGQILDNPNMLLALLLLGLAAVIVVASILILLFRRPKGAYGDADLYAIDSRIQALEMALSDQRILIQTIKSQGKADFGYVKQEMKDIYKVLEHIEYNQSRGIKAAS